MRAGAYRGKIVDSDTEKRIDEACRQYKQGAYSSMLKAAEAMEVPYATFRRRYLGLTRSTKTAHKDQCLLTPGQEDALVDWMMYLGMTGHPVNKRTLRPKVEALLPPNKRRPISKSWIRRFELRHPELKLARGNLLDTKRAQAFRYEVVHAHFKLLKEFMEEHSIPWENVYNMDEKGIQLGGGRKGTTAKHFFSREDKARYKVSNDDLQLVTVIEAVCADGSADIRPGFVFSGVTFCEEWFCEDVIVATSENGWTDDFIGLKWFELSFIPTAKARNKSGKPILLIYDGHGSHTTLEMIDKARENGIHLFCLPPHTTHKLQPLDVGVFAPLQRAWFERCDAILELRGEGIEVRNVVKEYMAARRRSFRPEIISTAWRKSGIRPINPDIFTAADYAPSHSTSRVPHAPSSFPTRLRRCFDASSDDLLDDGRPSTQANPSRESSHSDSDYTDDDFDTDSESESEGDGTTSSENEEGAGTVTAPSALLGREGPRCQVERPRSGATAPMTRSRSTLTETPRYQRQPIPSTKEGMRARIQELEKRVETVTYERDKAETHAIFTNRENGVLKYQKKKQQERQDNQTRRIYTQSRVLTSEQGREDAAKSKKVREEKEKAEREKKKRKEDKAAADRQRRANLSATIFAGALSGKDKTQLGDIAASLALSLEGSKADLRGRIDEHFKEHPQLKEDQRYLGLFSRRGQKRLSGNDGLDEEQEASLMQRRRLEREHSTLEGVAGNVLVPITNQQLAQERVEGIPYFAFYHPQYPVHHCSPPGERPST